MLLFSTHEAGGADTTINAKWFISARIKRDHQETPASAKLRSIVQKQSTGVCGSVMERKREVMHSSVKMCVKGTKIPTNHFSPYG